MGTYKGFDSVELRKPKRSKFDLSHERRLSTRMGRLTPIFMTEVIPNDTISCNSEVMLRLAPLVAPIMHRVNVFVHFFYVPNRILAAWWEPFITGGRVGDEVTTPPVPTFFEVDDAVNGGILQEGLDLMDVGSLWDYLGGPIVPDSAAGTWTERTIDVLPFAAYTKVWYDYYRDRNYVADDSQMPLQEGSFGGAGGNIPKFMSLRTRCWEHDYFTSAQTSTQRGAEVLMPLEGSGSVQYRNTSNVFDTAGNPIANELLLGNSSQVGTGALAVNKLTSGTYSGGNPTYGRIENIDSIELTTSDVSINDLRRAVALQQWLERNQLAGSRYNESIMAHFGRKTSDARLQRAEYLGGGKVPVQISEVVTTAFSADESAAVVPPGNMVGHGVSYGSSNHFSYNCEEHGFVIGIMSVLPTSGYMQGMPRMFQNRNTFLDYPWPTFAHLGEQEVFKSELYANPTNVPVDRTAQPVFGYQSRYADWKYMSSSSHGDFRESLDFWHLTRKFSSSPVLGETFVTFEDALQDRVFAVSDVDTLWCYIYNAVSVVRALPYFGTPML